MVKGEKINTHRTKLGSMIGANVRIGVNASIMPGIKIGSGSMIGAGVTLDTDLSEGSFCYAKGGYVVKKNTKHVSNASSRSQYRTKL